MTDQELARLDETIADVEDRTSKCWIAAEMFLKNKDFHGIMDMGAEVAALVRCRIELLRFKQT